MFSIDTVNVLNRYRENPIDRPGGYPIFRHITSGPLTIEQR